MLASAGLAYYFLMSLVPVLIVLTAVVAYLPFKNGMEGMSAFIANDDQGAKAQVLAAFHDFRNTIDGYDSIFQLQL